MSESILEKLKQKAREKELEKKVKAFFKKQIEREIMEQVRLIGAIYVEPLALHAPIVKEIIFFEQEHKSRELEEELKTTFNFLKKTTITTTSPTPTPQVIIISNSKKKVEILFQPIIEE